MVCPKFLRNRLRNAPVAACKGRWCHIWVGCHLKKIPIQLTQGTSQGFSQSKIEMKHWNYMQYNQNSTELDRSKKRLDRRGGHVSLRLHICISYHPCQSHVCVSLFCVLPKPCLRFPFLCPAKAMSAFLFFVSCQSHVCISLFCVLPKPSPRFPFLCPAVLRPYSPVSHLP